MTPRPADTTPASWSVYAGVLDRMDGAARVRAAIELSEEVREVRFAGMRARNPELSDPELIERWIAEEYGVDPRRFR